MDEQPTPRRPEWAAANVECIRCHAPDAYEAEPCRETGSRHIARFDAQAPARR